MAQCPPLKYAPGDCVGGLKARSAHRVGETVAYFSNESLCLKPERKPFFLSVFRCSMHIVVLNTRGALVGEFGNWAPLVLKKCFQGDPGGPNYSSHCKLLVLNNCQYFHIRVCQTKTRNRDYLEHCSVG